MTIGTFHLAQVAMSASNRSLERWTIWLTANGADGRIGMVAVVRGQLLGDLVDPFVELALRPRVQRREAADDPRLALGDDQVGVGNDEQRRADDRQAQAVEDGGDGHSSSSVDAVIVL